MPFTAGEVQRNLPQKGFQEIRGGDHVSFKFVHNGLETRWHTFVSHGKPNKAIGNDLVLAMKMQLGLQTLAQVRALVECTMDQAAYVAALKAAGHTLPEPAQPQPTRRK